MLLSGQLLLNGERVTSVHEQERVGNSYIDILAEDSQGNRHIIELKRSALLNKHREQVCEYVNKYCDKFRLDVMTANLTKTLIGTALSPNFSVSKAQEDNVNVLTIDRNNNLSQLVSITVTFTVTTTETPRNRVRDKNLNKNLNKGKGKGRKTPHPSPSPSDFCTDRNKISSELIENFRMQWGKVEAKNPEKVIPREPGGKDLAQLRDLSVELVAAGGCPLSYIREAFREAAGQGEHKENIRYVRAIMFGWLGIPKNRSP